MSNKERFLDLFTKTAEAKRPSIQAYVRELLTKQDKFLVFAHHHVLLDDLTNLLEKEGVGMIRIDVHA